MLVARSPTSHPPDFELLLHRFSLAQALPPSEPTRLSVDRAADRARSLAGRRLWQELGVGDGWSDGWARGSVRRRIATRCRDVSRVLPRLRSALRLRTEPRCWEPPVRSWPTARRQRLQAAVAERARGPRRAVLPPKACGRRRLLAVPLRWLIGHAAAAATRAQHPKRPSRYRRRAGKTPRPPLRLSPSVFPKPLCVLTKSRQPAAPTRCSAPSSSTATPPRSTRVRCARRCATTSAAPTAPAPPPARPRLLKRLFRSFSRQCKMTSCSASGTSERTLRGGGTASCKIMPHSCGIVSASNGTRASDELWHGDSPSAPESSARASTSRRARHLFGRHVQRRTHDRVRARHAQIGTGAARRWHFQGMQRIKAP